ncbi:MAG: PfkB family carbohydrate kinase [Spirochaetaceae bacterium]|jgi:ribokinase|nr:PfkB family carbohydrate kinase [Spirochaetaceae bacterium]
MKILVYGSINIDLTFLVDHIAGAGETIGCMALEKSAGGKGANQAASLAKAGMPVYLAGKIGTDGRFLLDLLRSYGVNTDSVAEYEGPTGQALIQIDKKKQNAIVVYTPGGTEK